MLNVIWIILGRFESFSMILSDFEWCWVIWFFRKRSSDSSSNSNDNSSSSNNNSGSNSSMQAYLSLWMQDSQLQNPKSCTWKETRNDSPKPPHLSLSPSCHKLLNPRRSLDSKVLQVWKAGGQECIVFMYRTQIVLFLYIYIYGPGPGRIPESWKL